MEDGSLEGAIFSNFHYQARREISDRALLADYLMFWLKIFVVRSLSHEVVIVDLIFLVVHLAFGKMLTLVMTVVANIQSELRILIHEFCIATPAKKTPSPRVELAYTYLMWYVMHCPLLMTIPSRIKEPVSYLQWLKNCTWKNLYLFYIWKTLHQETSYVICLCRPEFFASMYGVDLVDTAC